MSSNLGPHKAIQEELHFSPSNTAVHDHVVIMPLLLQDGVGSNLGPCKAVQEGLSFSPSKRTVHHHVTTLLVHLQEGMGSNLGPCKPLLEGAAALSQVAGTAKRLRVAINLMKNPAAFRLLCNHFSYPGQPGVMDNLEIGVTGCRFVANADLMTTSWTKFPLLLVRILQSYGQTLCARVGKILT
jgi:hypothetical protein